MADTTALLPLGWGTTVGLVSGPILPANPARNGLIFINPSSVGVLIAICPALVNQGVLGAYTAFAPGVAAIGGAGSITMAPNDKFIIDNLPCKCAWLGIASGPGGVITILEH